MDENAENQVAPEVPVEEGAPVRKKYKKSLPRELPLMNDTAYFKERLDSQIEWYNRKASLNQKSYRKYKTLEIILAASIPVIVSLSTMKEVVEWGLNTWFQVIAATSGLVLAITNSISAMEDFYKNWKTYRATCEALQQERVKYLACTDNYDDDDAYAQLVEKVESILNKEINQWKQTQKPKQNEELVAKAQAVIEAQDYSKLPQKTVVTKVEAPVVQQVVNPVVETVTTTTPTTTETAQTPENTDNQPAG